MKPERRSTIHWITSIGLAMLLVSCAQPPVIVHAPSPEYVAPPAEPAPEPAVVELTPPADVTKELIPPISLQSDRELTSPEPRFDVTVDRADARQFFMSLVEGTSYSLALAPGVTGEISLALRDVTIEEVLDTLQQAYGYGYEKTRTGFLVLPSGLRTQVYHLDYLNLHRFGSSETRVSSGQMSEQVNPNADQESVIQGENSESAAGSRIQTESDTDLWTEIEINVRAILSGGSGRSVVTSPNAGLLIVRCLPSEHTKVAQYLRRAEENLNRVVILEAKILEVTLNDGFQSGINWAQLASHNGDQIVIGQAGGGTVNDTGYSASRGASENLGPPLENLFAGTMSSAFGGVFSLAIQAEKFSAFIELLETQGSVSTLSNPRISTVNNQKAVIKVGSDEFFVTEVSTTTVTGTATTSSPNVTLTPFFSGIALDVTPQISGDDEVVLHVHPAVTEVVDQVKTFKVGGEIQELPLALSSIRESDSIVRARSGQIVVIGGLIQNGDNDTTYGIPWVSRIPFVGRLFEHSLVTNTRTELVILLRPVVVQNDETWSRELQNASRRLDQAWKTEYGEEATNEEFRLDGWLPPTPPVSR